MRNLVRLAIVGLLLFGTVVIGYETHKSFTTRKPTTNTPKSKNTNRDTRTADQKMVMPNWFSVSDDIVTLHSFIIHSGDQDVVHEISIQDIVRWHNQSQARLQRLETIQANSRLLTEITLKKDLIDKPMRSF